MGVPIVVAMNYNLFKMLYCIHDIYGQYFKVPAI